MAFNMFNSSGFGNSMMIQSVFSSIDRDGDGRIQFEELMYALQQLGLGFLNPSMVHPIFKMFDRNHNGTLDRDEFTGIVSHLMKMNGRSLYPAFKMSRFIMRMVFNKFDSDRDGFIRFEEFMMALNDLGLSFVSPSIMYPAFRMADRNGNGVIEYSEFERLVEYAKSMAGGGGGYGMGGMGGGFPMGGMGGGFPMGGMGGGFPMGGMGGGFPMGGMGGGFRM